MAGSAQDVEAGRAYVTLYLRRTNYDRQVDDLDRDNKRSERPSGAMASSTEAGISVPTDVAGVAARGAIMRLGGDAAVATLSKLGVVAAATAPAVASVGTAAAATAPAVAATGAAAAAATPAVAASGTAATGAATGFGAMAAAAAPILIPLAAIAVAAGAVYVVFAKWEKLPLTFRLLLLATSPLVVAIRALVLALKTLKLAVSIVTAPFRLAAAAVRLLKAAVLAIPSAIAAIPGLMSKIAGAAKTMAIGVAKAAAATVRSLAKVPGTLARYASSAVRGVSSALKGVGTSIAKVGAIAAGLSAAIVGPMTLAAKGWAEYGETIRGIQNDLLKFQLTAEEASIIARVSSQTGESVERLAEQIRDGTRDFSRWRNELQQSGMLMTGPGLGAALALSRAYYSLRESASGLKNAIGAALGSALTESTEVITGMIQGVTRWVNANRPLIVQVFKVASAVGIAATAITTLGGVVAAAGAVLSPFTAALAMIAGGLAIVEVRTDAGRSIWAAYGASVRRVYTTVVQYLGQMVEFVDTVIGGVTDALMAGDLAAAVDVMWSAAKVAWVSALLEIDTLTSGVFGGILQSLAAGRWAAAAESATNALQQAWLTGVDFLAGIWDRVVDAADSAWVGILSGFDTVIAGLKSGLASILGWAITNVFQPLVDAIGNLPGFDFGIEDKARKGLGKLLDMKGAAERSLEEPGADREGPLAARRAERQAASDAGRSGREREIESLRQRQVELAEQSGAAVKQEQTANQRNLATALAAATAAREAAAANRLTEEDFAVSQETQSIARFSGEALGLSVGRADDPARKTAKLSADQLKELKELRREIRESTREMLRLQAMGGFG